MCESEKSTTLTTTKRPTQAQENALYNLARDGGETIASPMIGPTPALYLKICALGWAEALGDNRFRITDAGKEAARACKIRV